MRRILNLVTVAGLVLTVAAMVAPATAFAATSAPSSASGLNRAATAAHRDVASTAKSCTGHTYFPLAPSGDITNIQHTLAGYFYYTSAGCVGTVREYVHYTSHATKTWRVHINGTLAASRTFTLNSGYYYWDFSIHRTYHTPVTVCVGASNTPGYSCGTFL
jgi:hypothetical protein